MPTTPPSPAVSVPALPDRTDRATFSVRATNAFDYLLHGFWTDLQTLIANCYNNAVEAYNSATASASGATASATSAAAALASANTAGSNAAAAATSAGATVWVSGTTYTVGATVYSPIDRRIYRRIAAGAGTTDPSADPTNWGSRGFEPIIAVASTSVTARAGNVIALDGTGSRTNQLLWSTDLSNAAWGKTNCTISANSVAAPDATTTGATITRTATGNHYTGQTITTTSHASQPYCASIWLKAGSMTGTVGLAIKDGANNAVVWTQQTLTTTWQRFTVSGTFGASPAANVQFVIDPNNDVGSAGDMFYAWHPQLESGLVPTPDIPTGATAVSVAGVGVTMDPSLVDNDEFTLITRNGMTTNVLDVGTATLYGNVGSLTGAVRLDTGVRVLRFKYSGPQNSLEIM